MKRQIAKVVIDLILAFCGAVFVYEFFVILTCGRIYPIPNFPVCVIGAIAILGVTGLGLWGVVTARYWRERLVSCLLVGAGCGLLAGHVIFPIFGLVHGCPVDSYYGQEPNTAILFWELITCGICGLVGLGNAGIDIYKLYRPKEARERGEKNI